MGNSLSNNEQTKMELIKFIFKMEINRGDLATLQKG